MSLFSSLVTLHLRGQKTGVDKYGDPVFGPPQDVDSPAWWEVSGSDEDIANAEQYTQRYNLLLPESAPVSGADAVTLRGVRDLRCELVGDPSYQPGGFVVDGYIRVVVERVSG